MSGVRRDPVIVNGKKGIIIRDKLTADGPVDPKTGEPLIDPKTGEPYPGENDDMANLMHEYLRYIRGSVSLKNGAGVAPRFGVLSLLAMSTAIYVYDHPRFKKIANTAFTDGINVFVDASFMRKLVDQEIDSGEQKAGTVFLILHELMHKLYNHVRRLKGYDALIANIAEDLVINGKLVKGFELKPVPLLLETGVGMKPEEADKYMKLSEETTAEMLLLNERKKKEKKQKEEKSQKSKNGLQGDGAGGDSGEQSDDDSGENNMGGKSSGNKDKEKQKEEKDGSGSNGEKNEEGGEDEEYSQIHHITPEELLEILKEEGLEDTVGAALNLPKAGDVEGLAKKEKTNQMAITDAVETALSQARASGGHYPGQHIAEEASDLIADLHKGKITWKQIMRQIVLGNSVRLKEHDDEAAIPWFLTKETMGVDPWYSGALVPQKPNDTVLALMDTSGSTGGGGMREAFASEILGLKKGVSSGSETASEVILWSADTVLRGEPISITEKNVNEMMKKGVPIFGNGGTCFATCLDQALSNPIMKKKKIKAVIYFTDCGDTPPPRAGFEKYINKGIKVVFVTTPSMWSEQWNREVGNWASVACIEENTVIDLSSKNNEISRKNKTF